MPAADRTHSPTPEDIMEYVDGEGTAAAREQVAAHLVTCAACRAIAEEQRGLSETARAWTVDAPPASLRPPAAHTAHAVPPRSAMWRRAAVVAGFAAAALLVLVVLLPMQLRARMSAPRPQTIDLQSAPAQVAAHAQEGVGGGVARTPAVIRTATMRIVVKEFDGVRGTVEDIVSQASGFIDQMTITGDKTTARELRGTVRVPGDAMAAALERLRQIGQVVEDTQGSQDVTDHIVDLDARMVSARATEKRLTELLANRTGKLSDVLEIEREITRVRLDIERLDAEKTNLGRRVTYATIDLTISEERKAGLDPGPLPIATRMRIAAADGLESALESAALTALLLLRAGPTLLFWGTAAGLVWLFGRRLLRRSA
jgi:predicted anti-sigma-YlaC factor YlaD